MKARPTLYASGPFVMYFPALARLFGSPLRAIIWQALAYSSRPGSDDAEMGYGALSDLTGIPERTLREHTKWLVEQGYLSRRRKSPMIATTVWTLEVAAVDAAGSADSIREPDPAGSADSIRGSAVSAGSMRQDLPDLDAAGSADSSFKKEELGGAVTYSGTEQQQPSTSSEDVKDEAHTPASQPGTVTRPVTTLPQFARAALGNLDNGAKAEWVSAWQTIAEQVTEETLWDPIGHLTRYFVRCKQLRKEPTPDEWMRWYTEDEAKARREYRIERENHRDAAQESHNPFWQ
jgi:hypothetical protein